MIELLKQALIKNGLLTAFVVVGGLMGGSYWFSARFTRGRLHGSAIAVFGGLVLAYVGGVVTGGKERDRRPSVICRHRPARRQHAPRLHDRGDGLRRELCRSALFAGVIAAFVCGAAVAVAFGYRDAVSIATLGAGAVTYIVGPVTGAALGASSEVIALSIAAGLVKAILVMIATPLVAKLIGLDNPHTAMIYGGTIGTNSGVAAGLAATDPKLVPYGVMAATFYTGLGCLLAPSVLFLVTRLVFPG